MTDQFVDVNKMVPITPSPELVQQWRDSPKYTDGKRKLVMVTLSTGKLQDIATQAARWGADQELEACVEWLNDNMFRLPAKTIRSARRPKPPSLKEQALKAMSRCNSEMWCEEMEYDLAIIRTALESLPS